MTPCTKVLVVEDEPAIREMLHDFLTSSGLEVVLAKDGAEALEVSAALPRPFVVLLDLHMPRVDGVEFLKKLRERDPASLDPVVVISADPDLDQLAAGLRAAAHFRKPFDLQPLLAALKRFTDPTL